MTSREKPRQSWPDQGKQKSLIIPQCPCLGPAWFAPVFSAELSLLAPVLSLFCIVGFVRVLSLIFSETGRECPFLSLSVPFHPFLSLPVPVRPHLSLSVPVCPFGPFLSLSVLVCPCLSLSFPIMEETRL